MDEDNDYGKSVEDGVYLDLADVDDVIELGAATDQDIAEASMSDMVLTETDDLDMATSRDTITDNSRLTFSAHKESVFAVRVNQSDVSLAVSGGQDNLAYVWSTITGQVIFSCTGHTDSVSSVGFSQDGALVATGDLGGTIKVWSCETHQIVWSFECSDIEWLLWHHAAHVLMCGTVDGDVWMWKIPSGECKTFHGSGAVAACGLIFSDGLRAAVGYDNGDVKIWDLKSSNCLLTISGHDGHSSSVVAMDSHHSNALLMTGSTDVTAKLFNPHTGKIIANFKCDKGDDSDGVESVALSQMLKLAAAGSLGGQAYIIDVTSLAVRHIAQHPAGLVKLRWHTSEPLLYTACLDGVVRSLDARTGVFLGEWSGHSHNLLDFDLSSDCSVLVTSSDDCTAKVYDLR